jgi:hypothetical protein
MRRWLAHLARAASVLLCVAATVMWWRSATVSEYVCREENAWALCFICDRGQLVFRAQWVRNPRFANPDDAVGMGWRHVGMRPGLWDAPPRPPYRVNWRFAGFMFRQVDTRRYTPTIEIALPWWTIALLSALPILSPFLRVYRGRRRARARRCARCNYDLRATRGRCPECGAIPDEQYRRPRRPLEKSA